MTISIHPYFILCLIYFLYFQLILNDQNYTNFKLDQRTKHHLLKTHYSKTIALVNILNFLITIKVQNYKNYFQFL